MKKLALTLTLLTLSGSLMAKTLVSVNGDKLDSSEIDRRAKLSIQQSQGQIQDSPPFRRYLLQEYIVETAVAQEAKKLKFDQTDDYKNAIAEAKKEAKAKGLDKKADYKANLQALENQLLGNLFARNVLSKNPVTDAQIAERHQQIHSRYHNTDKVQIGQIVTKSKDQAQAAIKELAAKKDFVSVAKQYSIDPAAKAGQAVFPDVIPLVDLETTYPKIHQVVHKLKKGQFNKEPLVSGSDNNQIFVVYYLNDRQTIKVDSLEKMKQDIGQSLADERINLAVDEVVKKANIVPVK